MRRRRRRGVGYGGGLGPSPEKVIFCPQNVNFWCILTRFLGKKFWDTDFTVPARNEAYKNSAKTTQYPKIQSDQRGAVAQSPPEYATVCIYECICPCGIRSATGLDFSTANVDTATGEETSYFAPIEI